MTPEYEYRKDKLFFYSPYNFIREIEIDKQLDGLIKTFIKKFSTFENNFVLEINIKNKKHKFYYSFLPWDSDYFKIKTYKLQFVLFDHSNFEFLIAACKEFLNSIYDTKFYLFTDIPSEDIFLIGGLNLAGFKLVETRVTYFRGDLDLYSWERYPVRKATEQDIPNLKSIASFMRNDFDRFHAESNFSKEVADNFLSTYIEQSIKGFTDIVLVPNQNGLPSDSFLTANFLKEDWKKIDIPISKMVLSAVSSKTNKGWYMKLISEMTYYLKEQGAKYIFMNTQTTNKSVIHTWEKLGYNYGCTNQILSIYKNS